MTILYNLVICSWRKFCLHSRPIQTYLLQYLVWLNFLLTKCLSWKTWWNNKKVVLLQLQENHLKRIIFCVVITFVFSMHVRFVKTSDTFPIFINWYCIEHIRGDMRWGGGSSRKYWIKKEVHLLFTWSAGGP